MKVLVACEFSGVVRDAFRNLGHDAWSCDLLPCEGNPAWHIQGDVRASVCRTGMWYYDLIIAHAPCTRLANSGARWLAGNPPPGKTKVQMWREFFDGVELFNFFKGKAKRVARENPIPHCHARELIGNYTQIIHPWQFGHKEMKSTCLWLEGLPKLEPTDVVGPPPKDKDERKKWARVHRESPGPDRWKNRSRTLQGIATAMAEQWGEG